MIFSKNWSVYLMVMNNVDLACHQRQKLGSRGYAVHLFLTISPYACTVIPTVCVLCNSFTPKMFTFWVPLQKTLFFRWGKPCNLESFPLQLATFSHMQIHCSHKEKVEIRSGHRHQHLCNDRLLLRRFQKPQSIWIKQFSWK